MVSAALKHVLAEWLADATSDKPSEEVMAYGLCNYVRGAANSAVDDEFYNLLQAEFKDACNPFDGSFRGYLDAGGSHHLNPARLAWVREVIE